MIEALALDPMNASTSFGNNDLYQLQSASLVVGMKLPTLKAGAPQPENTDLSNPNAATSETNYYV